MQKWRVATLLSGGNKILACPDHLHPLLHTKQKQKSENKAADVSRAMSTEVKLRVRLFVLLNATLGKIVGGGEFSLKGKKFRISDKKSNLGVT